MSYKNIKPSELVGMISEILEDYVGDIDEVVKKEVDKDIKEAKEELKKISPKSKKQIKTATGKIVEPGEYAASWTIGSRKYGKNEYGNLVYNKKHYRLTHLLEFGHFTRNGTARTKAISHIRPTEAKYGEKLLIGIEAGIRRKP